ncbi:MAG: FAD-binding protein [Xanthobacteraceae bacterium]|nr:MAG: FAD-binding protein [Xanthobacteraceae bacterium]
MDILKVRDASDVEDAVRAALAAGRPLEIVGHGSKRVLGRPVDAAAVLDLSALAAVTLYEPHELVLTVAAGAALTDVVTLLADHGQQLAFEPMDVRPLLGGEDAGTIGGMLGAALSGPRRIKAGGARDHFLGFSAVSGFGETFKAGGRVVKNVTGYDLCKLMAGSWGTLAVMTEVTLKVLPKAEAETTLMLRGLDAATANRAMTAALGSPHDVSGAAHLPASGLRGPCAGLAAGAATTLVRVEGIDVSVADRVAALRRELAGFGAVEAIEGEPSKAAWQAIRDVVPFAAGGALGAWPVWRIVCPPARGCALGEELARESGGEAVYDCGGGLIWLALPPLPDAGAALVHARAGAAGGHAMLFRAAAPLRASVAVFPPLASGLAALNRRVKVGFDPHDLFNRGRLHAMTEAS